MNELCGFDCCCRCTLRETACGGCKQTDGHPCGGNCFAAELVKNGGEEALSAERTRIICEVNELGIDGLNIKNINLLLGEYINLEYTLPSGQKSKLLRDNNVYWGNQIEKPGSDRCFGIAADKSYILICEYGCGGTDPEIILYKKR